MPNNLPASIFYTIAAYDLKQAKPLLFRKANRVADLQKLLDLALHRGAVIIAIQRIHPPPATKTTPETIPKPAQRSKVQMGNQA